MSRLRFPKEILDPVFSHARGAAPAVCCGLISGARGRRGTELVAIHEMDNVYDRYHQGDPAAWPESSRSAWLMEPAHERGLVRALSEVGTPAVCIYHSHVDRGPALTEHDQQRVLDGGGPRHPGVEYLVVSVRGGHVAAARSFRWNGDTYVGRDVPLGGE